MHLDRFDIAVKPTDPDLVISEHISSWFRFA
jgi:hypothetical protein